VTVDLERREVRAAGIASSFVLDDFTRWRLMEGLDDIGLTLRHDALISDFEARRPSWKPSATTS
jgi:3-isopropylmalate/(R)-2-methylmalate dehydratase small subunit